MEQNGFSEDFVQLENSYNTDSYAILSEFETDITLPEVEKTAKYITSELPVQRLVNMKRLGDVCMENDFSQVKEQLLPLCPTFVTEENQAIRTEFAHQLPLIAKACDMQFDNAGYEPYKTYVIPAIQSLALDEDQEVSQAAIEAFGETCQYIQKEDKPKIILSHLLELAHSNDEDKMMKSLSLFQSCLQVLGIDLCIQIVCPEVISLTEDGHFNVCKLGLQCLSHIAKFIGKDTTEEKIVPVFVVYSKDTIWSVRRTVAECISSVAEACSNEIRSTTLCEIVNRLLRDTSQWVVKAMLQSLGLFISLLPSISISDELLTKYRDLADENDPNKDYSHVLSCAYTLPAVAQALEGKNWDLLEGTFNKLYKHNNEAVRNTLACSLFEIAKIIGPSRAASSLSPALEVFLEDTNKVQFSAIKNLSKFWSVLTEEYRNQQLDTLITLCNDSINKNWRIRRALASQMPDFFKLFYTTLVYEKIVPIYFNLLSDPVSAVRDEAILALPSLLNLLLDFNNEFYIKTLEKFIAFYDSEDYLIREVFVSGLFQILPILSEEDYQKLFYPYIMNLLHDKISNVRLLYATLWKECRDKSILYYLNNEEFVKILEQDPYPEIVSMAKQYREKQKIDAPNRSIQKKDQEEESNEDLLNQIMSIIDKMFIKNENFEESSYKENMSVMSSNLLHSILQYTTTTNEKTEFTNHFIECFDEQATDQSILDNIKKLLKEYITKDNYKNLYNDILELSNRQ